VVGNLAGAVHGGDGSSQILAAASPAAGRLEVLEGGDHVLARD